MRDEHIEQSSCVSTESNATLLPLWTEESLPISPPKVTATLTKQMIFKLFPASMIVSCSKMTEVGKEKRGSSAGIVATVAEVKEGRSIDLYVNVRRAEEMSFTEDLCHFMTVVSPTHAVLSSVICHAISSEI